MMTFNTAFKHLYEKEFKPYDFQKVKGKRPYFLRMIGDEIFHMLTYRNCWSERPYKEFQIIWGIGTVYREKIDLDILPDKTTCWTHIFSSFVYRDQSRTDPERTDENWSDDVDMEEELDYSVELVKMKILPKMDKAVTLEQCYGCLRDTGLYEEENFGGNSQEHNEGLLSYILYVPEIYEEVRGKRMGDSQRVENQQMVMEMIRHQGMDHQPEIFKKYLKGEENHRLVVETLKRRKRENHERLRSHGIVF